MSPGVFRSALVPLSIIVFFSACSSGSGQDCIQKLVSDYGADTSQVPPSELDQLRDVMGPECDVSKLQGVSNLDELFPNLSDTLKDIAKDKLPDPTFQGELTITYPPDNLYLRSGVRVEGVCTNGFSVVVEGSAPAQSFSMPCQDGHYIGTLNFNQTQLSGDKTLVVKQTNQLGATKQVSRTLKHFEFDRYVAVANRQAKTISLYIARRDDGRLQQVAVTDMLNVSPDKVFARPGGDFFYVTSNANDLMLFKVDPTAASMGPLATTAMPDNNVQEEVDTRPISVSFSDTGTYAYVTRKAINDGTDIVTAYSVNGMTGQMTVLEADDGAGLFNRLVLNDGTNNIRIGALQMTSGAEGAFSNINGASNVLVTKFAMTGHILAGALLAGPLTIGSNAFGLFNRAEDRLYYVFDELSGLNYSFMVDPQDPFSIMTDFNVYEVDFESEFNHIFSPTGSLLYVSGSNLGKISRFGVAGTLTFVDDFFPENGASGTYELSLDNFGKSIFAVNSTINKVFSISIGSGGSLANVSALETGAEPSGVAVISLP